MNDLSSCIDGILALSEDWPVALAWFVKSPELAGGWQVKGVNQRARAELDWSPDPKATVYDWLRALGETAALRRWLNNPSEPELETASRRYWRLSFGDGWLAVLHAPCEDIVDWRIALDASRDLLAHNESRKLVICCDDGRVRFATDAADQERDQDPLYADQVLPATAADQAYEAIEALAQGKDYRTSGMAARKLAPDINLMAIRTGRSVGLGMSGTVYDAIIKGLDGVVIFVDGGGVIAACSADAEHYWSRPLQGSNVDDLLIPQRNGTTSFWEGHKSKNPEETAASKIWANRASGRIRVRVSRKDLCDQDDPLTLLRIEPIPEARSAEQAIHNLAHFDPLTGLPNRQLFGDRLAHAIEHAKRYHQLLVVMAVDVDRFKLINDSLGLEMGDVAIKAITERISQILNAGDTIARSGADEFLLLCSEKSGAEDAARLAKSIQNAFKRPVSLGPHDISVSVSIGIALYPHDGQSPADLLRNADTALGRAKAQGRNFSQFFTDDMNASAFERLMLENRLRKALQNNEMRVYYQPQVRIDSGRVVGVEALIRWFHPELGVISPAEFIPLAEETGLIVPIGLWAMEEACRQVQEWHRDGHEGLRLAVNLSALQFEQDDLLEHIQRVLRKTGLPVSCLELELTESVVMRNAEETVHRLQELRRHGLSLAVDDFGTGYSSLAYLKRFPLRSLKIDRSFVGDIDRDANSLAIIQAIVALGNALAIKLVAEGVETDQQLEKLRQLGCAEMQGYLFSRPLPPEDLATLLVNHNRLKLET